MDRSRVEGEQGLGLRGEGEAVVAAVVTTTTVDEQAVIAGLRGQLATFKVPKRVLVLDELPRNTMGKVQKNLLRERYATLFGA